MTGLNILLAVAGAIVTMLVIAGMVLLTQHEQVELYGEQTDPQGAELSRAEAPHARGRDGATLRGPSRVGETP